MRNRFKAKPNVSAARERAESSSVDGRTRVGSDVSSQSEAAIVLQLKGQEEGDSNVGRSVKQPVVTKVAPGIQVPLSRHKAVANQSGQVERVPGESSHPGGHFVDHDIAPLEPLVEYSEDALGCEGMVESEDIVTGSALAMSEGRSEGRGMSFPSAVSIGNLIAESYALCRDGGVSGSDVVHQSGGERERMVTALVEEDAEAVSESDRPIECVEGGEVVRAQLALCPDEQDEQQLGTVEGHPRPPHDSAPVDNVGMAKVKKRQSRRKRPSPATVPKGKDKEWEREEEEELVEEECVTSLSPAKKRSRRQSSKEKAFNDAPDLGKMTVAELISYKPSANPMQSSLDAKEKQRNGTRKSQPSHESVDGVGSAEGVSNSRPLPHATATTPSTGTVEMDREGDENVDEDGRLVPQLMVDKDGKIVVNENSMIVHSSRLDPEVAADKLETVYEIAGDFSPTTSGSRRRRKMKLWTEDETKLFYRALSQVGTDFTMMALLMAGRTRVDLKKKFKREERTNPHKVNSALKRRLPITTTTSPIRLP